jgi:hypothetical protein
MILTQTDLQKTLSIIATNTNKALLAVVKDLSPKELSSFTQTKDLSSLFNSLLKESSSQQSSQNKALLQLLKNSPTFKELSNVTTTLSELKNLLDKNDLQNTSSKTSFKQLQTLLANLQEDINAVDPKVLQSKLQNSGVFLESKLKNFQNPLTELSNKLTQLTQTLQKSQIPQIKNIASELATLLSTKLPQLTQDELPQTLTQIQNRLTQVEKTANLPLEKKMYPKDILFSAQVKKETSELLSFIQKPHNLSASQKIDTMLSEDLKAQLLQAKEEIQQTPINNKAELVKQIDKLLLQIDYYQLVSHLSQGSAIFIPYAFEMLEDGHIRLKKAKNRRFFCDIELTLKEYGQLNIRLGLFEAKDLSIHISTQSQELQALLEESLPQLKQNLFNAGLYPRDISFINKDQKQSRYETDSPDLQLGFEAKV